MYSDVCVEIPRPARYNTTQTRRHGSGDPRTNILKAPLVNELSSDGSASFHFINGNCEAVPPEGFEDFFGKPPYYRFIEPDEKNTEDTDVLSRVSRFPFSEPSLNTTYVAGQDRLGNVQEGASPNKKIPYYSDTLIENC